MLHAVDAPPLYKTPPMHLCLKEKCMVRDFFFKADFVVSKMGSLNEFLKYCIIALKTPTPLE